MAIVFGLSAAAPIAQPASPVLDEVLARMSAYLATYESQLTALTADERYEQREVALVSQAGVGGTRVEVGRLPRCPTR